MLHLGRQGMGGHGHGAPTSYIPGAGATIEGGRKGGWQKGQARLADCYVKGRSHHRWLVADAEDRPDRVGRHRYHGAQVSEIRFVQLLLLQCEPEVATL